MVDILELKTDNIANILSVFTPYQQYPSFFEFPVPITVCYKICRTFQLLSSCPLFERKQLNEEYFAALQKDQ